MSDPKPVVLCCGGPPPPDAAVLPSICPKCGGETEIGYGLMGGGIGTYVACWADGCDFFAKRQDPDE